MAGITKGLKRALMITSFVLFVAGSIAIGISAYFLFYPFKRRAIIIQPPVILVTLGLGAYIWFNSLNVSSDYSHRWNDWSAEIKGMFQDEGKCCGYDGDRMVLSNFCTQEMIDAKNSVPCKSSIQEFVNYYLQNIYTALFLYAIVDFFTLLMCLVTLKALQDMERYERSMRKMINLHNLEDSHLMSPEQVYGNEEYGDEEYIQEAAYNPPYPRHQRKESYLPMAQHRASVVYTYT
ncbi:hypothetical protein K502DRAFT_328997 [Neoconidiobolus thromboides FSU 785]|nr:hypothetical protein K502DRAFT_328997 [Neoconidiobolus thromboides FSU 785]